MILLALPTTWLAQEKVPDMTKDAASLGTPQKDV
jgi:hypothetical protein